MGGPTWQELKPNTPYGALPVLTVDENCYAQSKGIDRYCANRAGLYPTCGIEAMRVDEIMGALEDLGKSIFTYQGKDPEKRREIRIADAKINFPRYFGGVEKRLVQFGDGPYAVGDSLTAADIAIFVFMLDVKAGFFDHIPTDSTDSYPRAGAIFDLVFKHPKVAAWYKDHPVTLKN